MKPAIYAQQSLVRLFSTYFERIKTILKMYQGIDDITMYM